MKAITILKKYNACTGKGSASEWVGNRTPKQAWMECERGDWLACAVVVLGIDRKLICAALVEIVRPVLRYVPDVDDKSRIAIETLERWTRGDATIKEVRDTAAAAYAAYSADDAADSAAYAAAAAYSAASAADSAASAAYVATSAADAAAWASAAAYAAAYAAYSAADDAADSAAYSFLWRLQQRRSLKQSAKIIREHIPWKMVREKLGMRKKDSIRKRLGMA